MAWHHPAPYPQPLANPARSSVANVELGPVDKPRLGHPVALTAPYQADVVRWLLAGPNPDQVLAVGKLHHWLVDVRRGEVVATDFISERTLVTFLPGGDYLYRPGDILIQRPAGPMLEEEERGEPAYVPDLSQDSAVNALVPLWSGEVILALQQFSNPEDRSFKEALVVRKPLTPTRRDAAWVRRYPQYCAPSPALPDGTVALHLPGELRLIDPAGRERRVLELDLMSGVTSADPLGRLWGFQETADGVHLRGLSAQGDHLVDLPVHGSPTQPPLPLSDGSVLAVTSLGLLRADMGQVRWEKPLRGGGGLLATATADRYLLVKGGDMLTLMHDTSHRCWSVRSGGRPITANPVVTAGGQICIACGLQVMSLEPRDEAEETGDFSFVSGS